MPDLIRLRDDEVRDDYLVISGDVPGPDACVSFRGYSDGRNTEISGEGVAEGLVVITSSVTKS